MFLFGQEHKISTSSTALSLKDQFSISISIPYSKNLKISSFPEIADFSKKQTEFIRQDSIIKITQYYQPRKAGNFNLHPFNLWINSDKIPYKKSLLIKISPSEKSNLKEKDSSGFANPDIEANLKAEINQTEIYTGAPLTYSLYLVVNAEADYNFIDFHDQIISISNRIQPENAVSENLSLPEKIETDSIIIDGKKFLKYQLFQTTYYPLSEGIIKIPSVKFQLLTYKEKKGTGIIERRDTIIGLKTSPSNVVVKPLSGSQEISALLPGTFKLKEKIKKTKNGSFLYSIEISGKGNVAAAYPPIFNNSPELDIYPAPFVKDHPNIKTFNYYLIPKTTNNIKLRSKIFWPYFNINTGKADTLRAKAIIKINPSTKEGIQGSSDDEFLTFIQNENNKLRKQEDDIILKIFTNLVILFMFAVTAILIIRK